MVGHVPIRDMDLDAFKAAVDSLLDHPGMIGVIGGEPLLWPHFEEATAYLVERTGGQSSLRDPTVPASGLAAFLQARYGDIHAKRGLFTSFPPGAKRYLNTILSSYQYVGYNTHEHPGLHQQFLVASAELPIAEDVRRRMIDNCWVNKLWSCGITPQGAWPCEIMGTLAHAFDGPGPTQGWPVEKGWWRRRPKEWGDMLRWCDACGAAMDVPRLPSTSPREIVSPGNYERLVKIGSRKVAREEVEVLSLADYDAKAYQTRKHIEWYLPQVEGGDTDVSTRLGPEALCRLKDD
jgi:hypothetical protein